MIQLAYVSSTSRLLTGPEIADLLIKSRANNARLGITGILLYKAGGVLQVLEGGEADVTALFATIERDRRHQSVILLFKKPVDGPDFPDWRMAFRDLNSKEVADLEGVSEVSAPHFNLMALDPEQAAMLLRKFMPVGV
jgi:hypothetical protein